MPLVIPQNFMQITLYHRYSDSLRLAACTFGVHDETGTQPPIESLNIAGIAWANTVLDTIHEDVALVQAIGTVQVGGNYFTVSTGTTQTGGGGDFAAPPPQVAARARKNTVRAGRAGRGSFSIPWCMPESDVNALGRIENARLDTLGSACEELREALIAEDLPMVILHNEGVPGGTTPTEVISITMDPQVGTQRRRNRA